MERQTERKRHCKSEVLCLRDTEIMSKDRQKEKQIQIERQTHADGQTDRQTDRHTQADLTPRLELDAG